jgi:hypothetical protein
MNSQVVDTRDSATAGSRRRKIYFCSELLRMRSGPSLRACGNNPDRDTVQPVQIWYLPRVIKANFRSLLLLPFVLLVPLCCHAITLRSGSVNEEYLFGDAAEGLLREESWQLDQYFRHQANSLGLPIFSALTGLIFGITPTVTLNRMIVLLASLTAIGAMGRRIEVGLGQSSVWLWCILVLVNPVVWCMLGYGTVDLLPAMLAGLAVLLTLGFSDSGVNRLSVVQSLGVSGLFALATVLKYHSFILAGATALWIVIRSPKELRSWLVACTLILPSFVWIVGYGLWTEQNFGFFLVPPHFKEVHFTGWIGQVVTVLSLYLTFAIFLMGPLALIAVIALKPRLWTLVLGVAGGGLAAYGSMLRLGEMDFGAVSGAFPPFVILMLFAVCGCIAVMIIAALFEGAYALRLQHWQIGILVICSVYLMSISFSRPAQRYLVFVFPLLLTLLWPMISACLTKSWGKQLVALYVGVFLPVSLAGQSFLSSQGDAASQIVVHAREAGLLCETDFSAIRQHVGEASRWCDNVESFTARVSQSPGPSLIDAEAIRVFGFPVKSFYLNRIEIVPKPALSLERTSNHQINRP